MCNPINHIKLCTCGAVDEKKNKTWQLVRGSTHIRVVGDFMPPSVEPVKFNLGDYLEAKIVSDLNTYDVFDFEYKPTSGDTLTIWLNNREHHFAVLDNEFVSMPKDLFLNDGSLSKAGQVRVME